ncbi:hypothetical protein [Prevotella sp. oral taxon 317]|uniref:hypothetical protein n=1 Tax=Prevotella sp. oral taxon 317 TaxID=652721 RepID=UPI0001C3F357|nr:hypothetical protein [Prevotella sp. oral taxon 317]EFC67136.1 hypothetical protein HMPREF0670_02867 [Prevotella sp. oral taxon 317 str. F0108]
MMQIEGQREESYKSLGTPPCVPTMTGETADPDNTGYGYEGNDTYKNKHGDNIPLYTPEPSNDTPKTAVAVEQHQKHEQKKSNKE